MLSTKTCRWTLPADLDRVGPLVLEAAGTMEERGVPRDPLFRAQLLLEETVTNVVRHAFGGDTSHDLHVRLTLGSDTIELSVEDDGPPFDPLHEAPVPDTDAALLERTEGGLGLHLVKQLADMVRYERDGALNRLRMNVGLQRRAPGRG